ncbi:MAG: transglutaminase-like domain-containing protein, partial [Holophagales bacterium]|nr:transglutaminase-like domain-containing protein [Holophagales bacterium]
WSVRFDCFAQSGIQRVLASIASDEWNAHFFPVNHALESDGLQLWWNDEANRQKIKLQFNQSGQLTGELFNRQGQQKAEGVFSRTSATPTDGGFHVKPQDNFIRHLRSYNGFGRSDAGPVVFEYDYSHSKLTELKEKYNLTSVAGVGDTQSKAIKLLNWLCKGTHHKNYNFGEMNSLALLEYAYGKGADKGLNCYNLSVILSEMCLSAGIQARALWLYPMNPNDGDNHVVVMAWIPERDKWIMLDPSFNAYFSDSGGNALSPDEIRDMIAQGSKINLNQDSKIDYSQYLNYMAKDMFYFNSSRKTGFGTFSGPIELIYFCPDGFDLADWRVKNARFRNTFDNPLSAEELAKREENMRQAKYIYATPESFWGK